MGPIWVESGHEESGSVSAIPTVIPARSAHGRDTGSGSISPELTRPFQLDSGALNHVAPFFIFRGDQGGGLVGGAAADSSPICAIFDLNPSDCSALLVAALSLSMIGFGVPAGATIAVQVGAE